MLPSPDPDVPVSVWLEMCKGETPCEFEGVGEIHTQKSAGKHGWLQQIYSQFDTRLKFEMLQRSSDVRRLVPCNHLISVE